MMRPVERGDHPVIEGKAVVFKKYGDARRHLVERLGRYCSYCEMRCNQPAHIEHVLPKSLNPPLRGEEGESLSPS